MNVKVKVGDRLEWSRAGDKNKCTVLEVKEVGGGKQRANLKIDGWLGTNWETIDHNFTMIEK